MPLAIAVDAGHATIESPPLLLTRGHPGRLSFPPLEAVTVQLT